MGRGGRFSARVGGGDGVEGVGVLVGEVVEQARRQLEHRDAVAAREFGDQRGFGSLPGLQDGGAAVEQGAPELEAEGVPGNGGALEEDFVGSEVSVGLRGDRGDQVAVGGQDALRPARRPGGEHQACGVVTGQRNVEVQLGQVRQFRRRGGHRGPGSFESSGEGGVGDEEVYAGVGGGGLQAFVGEVGVEEGVGGAGLGDGDDRGGEVRAAFQQDAGQVAAAQSLVAQVAGPAVGGRVELPVGDLPVAVDQRDPAGETFHLLLEALHQ